MSLKQIAEQNWFITEQISLRKFAISDAAELFLLTDNNRNYLKEWLGWVDNVREVQDSLNFIKHTDEELEQNKSLTFGIFFGGALKGVIGFNEINWEQKQAVIGYWLEEKFQGQGIVTLACKKLVDIGFRELYLKRININCAEENYKSQAVPKRLGFTKGETLRNKEWLYDRFVNHIVYSLENKR